MLLYKSYFLSAHERLKLEKLTEENVERITEEEILKMDDRELLDMYRKI